MFLDISIFRSWEEWWPSCWWDNINGLPLLGRLVKVRRRCRLFIARWRQLINWVAIRWALTRAGALSSEVSSLLCVIEDLCRLAVIVWFITIICAPITSHLILEAKWDSRSWIIRDNSIALSTIRERLLSMSHRLRILGSFDSLSYESLTTRLLLNLINWVVKDGCIVVELAAARLERNHLSV